MNHRISRKLDSCTCGKQRGTALFAVVPIAILMMSLMVAFVGTGQDTSRAVVANGEQSRTRSAAVNAAALAITSLWGDFEAIAGGQEQLWRLRTYLDSRQMVDQAGVAEPETTDSLATLGLPRNMARRFELDGVEIARVDVHRVDRWDATDIVVEVEAISRRGQDGSSREKRSSILQVFTISPPEWDGLDYALLANNINCLLCHTNIDSAERFYNVNESLAGTFDSVKVGSIESIHFRADPDSQVAGVLLIGADALLGDGHEIDDWTQFNLRGAAASPGGQVAKIMEDSFGNPIFGALDIFDPNAPSTSANLYLDFFDHLEQTGYNLPTSFPAPFPDNGGYDTATGSPRPDLADNGIVDDSEFHAAVYGSSGAIAGGNISLIGGGDTITSAQDWSRIQAGTDSALAGIVSGNVYLHGTKNDPILLDGQVGIDGDVILSGYVKGSGSLKARGNVYITGDVLYDDGGNGGSRTFGTANDGTTNSLAIAAGGNIVIGDYYHRAWETGNPATGTTSGSFNFTLDELAIFNRMEWMKTQPTLPGKTVYIQVGTKEVSYPETVAERYQEWTPVYQWLPNGQRYQYWFYKDVTTSNGLPEPYTKYTTTRVKDRWEWRNTTVKTQTGVKQVWRTRQVPTGVVLTRFDPIMEWVTPQVSNAGYQALHTARYYAFDEGQKIPVFNKKGYYDPATEHWVSDERAGKDDGSWDTSKLTMLDPNNKNESLLYHPDKTPKAVISSISPTDGWINAARMADVLAHSMGAKQDHSKTFEVNATLYSANAIIGITPSRDAHFTNGKLIVNGGIVAADVGLLAPNGTQINYDGRGARALSITADSGLTIKRTLTAPRVRG